MTKTMVYNRRIWTKLGQYTDSTTRNPNFDTPEPENGIKGGEVDLNVYNRRILMKLGQYTDSTMRNPNFDTPDPENGI